MISHVLKDMVGNIPADSGHGNDQEHADQPGDQDIFNDSLTFLFDHQMCSPFADPYSLPLTALLYLNEVPSSELDSTIPC